jgi:hypothetical protein
MSSAIGFRQLYPQSECTIRNDESNWFGNHLSVNLWQRIRHPASKILKRHWKRFIFGSISRSDRGRLFSTTLIIKSRIALSGSTHSERTKP